MSLALSLQQCIAAAYEGLLDISHHVLKKPNTFCVITPLIVDHDFQLQKKTLGITSLC